MKIIRLLVFISCLSDWFLFLARYDWSLLNCILGKITCENN